MNENEEAAEAGAEKQEAIDALTGERGHELQSQIAERVAKLNFALLGSIMSIPKTEEFKPLVNTLTQARLILHETACLGMETMLLTEQAMGNEDNVDALTRQIILVAQGVLRVEPRSSIALSSITRYATPANKEAC